MKDKEMKPTALLPEVMRDSCSILMIYILNVHYLKDLDPR